MGHDIRDIPLSALDSIPSHLTDRGFEVTISQKPGFAPGVTFTQVYCRRGVDCQRLAWASLEHTPGIIRILITNQDGWLPWVRRRRFQLQADVTSAIEDLGGYWPPPN